MTKARFQHALYLDAETTAFLAFAQAKGRGKSRADVIRKLITARRLQYQEGFHRWLRSPEGQARIRAEGLGTVSSYAGPVAKARISQQAVEELLAAPSTPIEALQGESGSGATPDPLP